MIIFIAFIAYFNIKRYDRMRITLARIRLKQKLYYMLSIYYKNFVTYSFVTFLS